LFPEPASWWPLTDRFPPSSQPLPPSKIPHKSQKYAHFIKDIRKVKKMQLKSPPFGHKVDEIFLKTGEKIHWA
jgi:hypothetical protein